MGAMKEMYMQEMYNEQERVQTGFDIDHELKEREYENAKPKESINQ